MKSFLVSLSLLLAPWAVAAAQAPPAGLGLDVGAMDRTADPCVDFYAYACGGWIKKNPIPGDQSSWAVYLKMFDDNGALLREVLEAAAKPDPRRSPVDREIGDFYAACMDQATIDKAGVAPIRQELAAIAAISSAADLADVVADLNSELGANALVPFASLQDFKDSSQVIAGVGQGGLGLPDRDYYFKDDAKSVEIRQRYGKYLEAMFGLLGDGAAEAQANAKVVVEIETALAKVSLTAV
ncbi:MAG TPA: M13 family metallopeptidase N-terminal domain-containing protein, partial [Thermoanaerobaculia bacterium]